MNLNVYSEINVDVGPIFEKGFNMGYAIINDGVKRLIKAIGNFFTDNVFKYIKKECAVPDSYVTEFVDALNQFKKILWEDKLYRNDEYYYFDDIVRISSYLANNKKSLLECTTLISEVLAVFFNVIVFKTKLSEDDYEDLFYEFQLKLHELKDKFYGNYYIKSDCYNERVMEKMRQDLWDLKEGIR